MNIKIVNSAIGQYLQYGTNKEYSIVSLNKNKLQKHNVKCEPGFRLRNNFTMSMPVYIHDTIHYNYFTCIFYCIMDFYNYEYRWV